MKDRQIIFSAPMVRALLEGRKTQTRRVITKKHSASDENRPEHCPYGLPGDRLWVRESTIVHASIREELRGYMADGCRATEGHEKAMPSIHMRRSHCRIHLEITEVRVQRLQEIGEQDALAEGIPNLLTSPEFYGTPIPANPNYQAIHIDQFAALWASINGPGSWDADPWVWALTFKVSHG